MNLRQRVLRLDLSPTLKDDVLTLTLPVTASSGQLWELLTDPVGLTRWSPFVPDRTIEGRGELTAKENAGDEPYSAQIIEYTDRESYAHTWGDDQVRWVIEGRNLRCEMTLARPEYASYYAAGWQVCLAVLQSILEGEPHERTVGEDAMAYGWIELQENYLLSLPGQKAAHEAVGD